MLSITIVYKRFADVYVTIAFKARVVDRCFKRARIHRLSFQFNRDSLVSSLLRFFLCTIMNSMFSCFIFLVVAVDCRPSGHFTADSDQVVHVVFNHD